MTRNRTTDVVRLSAADWLAAVLLVTTLVGAAWRFTLDLSADINSVKAQLNAVDRRLDQLEARR